jgi:hypothetical protein
VGASFKASGNGGERLRRACRFNPQLLIPQPSTGGECETNCHVVGSTEPGFQGMRESRVFTVNYCLSLHLQLLTRFLRLQPRCCREHKNLKRFLVGVVMAMNGSQLSSVLNALRDQRQRSTAGFVLGSLPKNQARKWSLWRRAREGDRQVARSILGRSCEGRRVQGWRCPSL